MTTTSLPTPAMSATIDEHGTVTITGAYGTVAVTGAPAMRLVFYMAHPLAPTSAQISWRAAAGSPEHYAAALNDNLHRAMRWLMWLRRSFPGVTFIAPWIAAVAAGDDDADPAQREAGLVDAEALIPRLDGAVLVGGRVSSGMERERRSARLAIDLTDLGEEPPMELYSAELRGCVPAILAAHARPAGAQ